MEVKIDEGLLTEIANITGGQYFRATSNKKLEEIYKEIDALEKSKIDVQQFNRKSEEFMPFAILGALFLIAAISSHNSFQKYSLIIDSMESMEMFRFENSGFLWGLLIIPDTNPLLYLVADSTKKSITPLWER
jgi:hypothetical protein